MDFIARAGRMLDKSHKMTGILLVVVVVQMVGLLWMFNSNSALSRQIVFMRETMPVYVVPGSTASIYRPEQGDTLAVAFTDFITQSLYTYTYQNYREQYQEVKKLFTPQMLRFADGFFGKKIENARNIKASEHFIPNRQSMSINKIEENGEEFVSVNLQGSLQQIINGSVVQTKPIAFNLRLKETLITRANPFGLQVASLRTREIQ